MTHLANRTSRRHDEARAYNKFNRATAFYTTSVELAQQAALFFDLFFDAQALAFRFLA
jgi:hypothetical protein